MNSFIYWGWYHNPLSKWNADILDSIRRLEELVEKRKKICKTPETEIGSKQENLKKIDAMLDELEKRVDELDPGNKYRDVHMARHEYDIAVARLSRDMTKGKESKEVKGAEWRYIGSSQIKRLLNGVKPQRLAKRIEGTKYFMRYDTLLHHLGGYEVTIQTTSFSKAKFFMTRSITAKYNNEYIKKKTNSKAEKCRECIIKMNAHYAGIKYPTLRGKIIWVPMDFQNGTLSHW